MKKGDIIQILRKGYYICDSPFNAASNEPCRLLNIPDGAVTAKPTALKTTNNATPNTAATATAAASGPEVDQLVEQITKQGEVVRQLKTDKAAKVVHIE